MSTITFTDHLISFANALDALDRNTYESTLDLVEEYFKSIGVITFAALTRGIRVNGQPGLEQVWGDTLDRGHFSIQGDQFAASLSEKYEFQSAYAYETGRPLWIVSDDPAVPLAQMPTTQYRDQWNADVIGIPYRDRAGGKSHTAVYMPLRIGKRIYGILNFEFDRQVRLTDLRRREVQELTDGLATIIWLRRTSEQVAANTRQAYSRFVEKTKYGSSALIKTNVFLANAGKADKAVVDCIRDVIQSYHFINLVHWQDMNAPGMITDQIESEIKAASFGVCYLSELDSEAAKRQETPFRDNSNVLFEAGMLHALKRQNASNESLWIAIREKEGYASPTPFDIAHMRLITVPRDQNGVVETDKLTSDIREMIDWILENI